MLVQSRAVGSSWGQHQWLCVGQVPEWPFPSPSKKEQPQVCPTCPISPGSITSAGVLARLGPGTRESLWLILVLASHSSSPWVP